MSLITPGGHGLGYVRRPEAADHGPLAVSQVLVPDGLPEPALPATVDLRHLFLPAFDQGQYGTCTCNGAASQLEYELIRQRVTVPYHRSRSFAYYYSGVLQGDTSDTGRDPRDVFSAIAAHGDCPEKDWQYYPTTALGQTPSAQAQQAASRRKFLQWYQVPVTQIAVKQALTHGYTVGMAFAVYSSFESGLTLSTGVVTLPVAGEQLLGYHYVVIGGYTDIALPDGTPANSFIVLNSWGTGVGKNGWMFFPYEFLNATGPDQSTLVNELLALELVTP